ncbi:MAG: TIGR04282 family arsenosugar biosynthesis glycosyltransferase [Opitutales bacterium]
MRCTAVVLLKAPRPGTVKTRLAVTHGDAFALRVYRALAQRQLAAVPTNWQTLVAFAPGNADAEMRAWLGPEMALVPQPVGDLGSRICGGLEAALAGDAEAVFALGADCPALTRPRLQLAARALRTHDAVLGPATDGGYYLLGMKQVDKALFQKVAWSTSSVAAETRQRLRALRWQWAELPTEDDVDDAESLARVEAAGLFEPHLTKSPVN